MKLKRKRIRRRGASLLEALLLGTLISVTLTLMSLLVQTLLSSSREITTESQVRRTAARLQSQWWEDVQGAEAVEVPADQGELLWKCLLREGEVIEYYGRGAVVASGEVTRDAQVARREEFRLPRGYRFTQLAANHDKAWLGLQVERRRAAAAAGPETNAADPPFEPTGFRIAALAASRVASNQEPPP